MGKNFTERLKGLIGSKEIKPFSRKCGVSEGSIRHYLKGGEPGLDKVMKIAEAAGVSVGWLAAGEGESAKQSGEISATATIKQGNRDVLDLSTLPVALRAEIRDLLAKATDIIISTDQNRQTLTNTINIIHQSLRQEQEIAGYKEQTINQIKKLAALEKEMNKIKNIKERKNVAS